MQFLSTSLPILRMRGATGSIGILLLVLLIFASTDAFALDESRAIHWSWRIYGGDSGDFDSPDAAIAASNADQEARYEQEAATNCGSAYKIIYNLVNAPAGPGAIVNGQATYLDTDHGIATSYYPACYVDGVLVRDAMGPYSTQGGGEIAVSANLACPKGWDAKSVSLGTVVAPDGTPMASYQEWCTRDVPDPPLLCKGGKTVGNPIDALGEAKIQSAVDFTTPDGLLRVARSYSSSAGRWYWENQPALTDFTGRGSGTAPLSDLVASLPLIPAGIYSSSTPPAVDTAVNFPLLPSHPDQPAAEVWAIGGDGTRFVFTDNGASFSTGDLEKPALTVSGSGASLQWTLRTADRLSLFDASGRQTQQVLRDGKTLKYSYQPNSITVTAYPGGRQLIYAQSTSGGPFDQVTLPGGALIHYQINAFGQVENVAFPDSSITYLYNEPNNTGTTQSTPAWLTGWIDEAGVRQATYRYDGANAISTEQAGGVGKFSLSYLASASSGTSTVTPPVGAAFKVSWLKGADGRRYLTSQNQPAGSGCSASTSNQQYDANGNIAQKDDFDGHRACYAYDTSRNLETTRIEGLNTSANCSSLLANGNSLPAASRKTSTQWHPDWRLATKVAEPGKLTTNVYNGQPDPFNDGALASCAPSTALLPDGKAIVVLCKKVEQATADADGSQGFNATLDTKVPNRVWSYSYNQYGQVLTAKGPRTDVNDTTTYVYYSDTTSSHTMGDLQSVTDALGHATNYTQYDAYGNVLEQVDANGVATDYGYDARQRLKTVKVGSQTTSYDYWPTGLLKQVTWPDQSTVAYGYDDAHRLTDVSDSQGNSVHYVLDNAGNRKAEQYKDPSGSLKRELDRAYDALGRVQQTTGRE